MMKQIFKLFHAVVKIKFNYEIINTIIFNYEIVNTIYK